MKYKFYIRYEDYDAFIKEIGKDFKQINTMFNCKALVAEVSDDLLMIMKLKFQILYGPADSGYIERQEFLTMVATAFEPRI